MIIPYEHTITLPIGMDFREDSMAKLKRLGLDVVAAQMAGVKVDITPKGERDERK